MEKGKKLKDFVFKKKVLEPQNKFTYFGFSTRLVVFCLKLISL